MMMTNSTHTTPSLTSIRKVRLVWAFAILGMIASALLVAGRAHAETLGFSVKDSLAPGADPSDLSVVVLDENTGTPVSDAAIAVSDSLQDETGASRGNTSAQGSLTVKGALARGPRTLNVYKDGYAAVSITGVQSAQVTVYLKSIAVAPFVANGTVMADGEMARWPGVGDDDNVHAGLVFKSLSALDLLHFTTDSFVSPIKDTIDVMGAREIPSNFVIPSQDIPVFIFPIHVSKPTYRLPVAKGAPVRLAGVQGTLPSGDISSLAQSGGKISMEILNKITFTHAGITAPITTTQDFRATIDASNPLSIRHQVKPNAAPFAADILVAAATDLDGTRMTLLPTDIKLAASASNPTKIQEVRLAAPKDGVGVAHDILTIALADKGHRVSGIVTDRAGARVSPGEFLAAGALPDSVNLPENVSLSAIPNGVAAAVYESQGTAVWYVYALPGAGISQIPAKRLPATTQITSYSIMSLDFGTEFTGKSIDGQAIMATLKRFARSSASVGQPKPDSFR